MIHYGKNTLIRRLCLMNAWWMNGIRLLTFSSSFVGYFLLPSQYINCLSSNRAQVALFISILTSFIDSTISQLQRNPADITNDLLVAIYNQQVAQSSNISIPPVNPTSYFNLSQADYDAAVTQNALLYITLSLFIVVSVIALVAKLWLVSYSSQVFSVGSPYDRVMKRQEAYNGVLVWNLGGDKHVGSHSAHCSSLVWALCLVRYFISSPVNLNTNTSHQQVGFGSSSQYWPRHWSSPSSRPYVFCLYISCCSVHFRMPVPLRIFGCCTIYFRKASDNIKADLVRKTSMAVDWNPHIFVDCISRSGSICYRDRPYLAHSIFSPSRFSHHILDTAGGSSQTSKV